MKDWSGNTNSVFKIISASNHSDDEREENDFYATDPVAIDKLYQTGELTCKNIWECACGEGHLAKKLVEYGYKVYIFSQRILCAKNGDFDKTKANGGSAVAYAWYVWEKGYTGDTIIKWI